MINTLQGNSTWEVTKSSNYTLFYIVDKLKFTEK